MEGRTKKIREGGSKEGKWGKHVQVINNVEHCWP